MANEIRTRANLVSGTGLTTTNVATSITQAGFANLPTIDTTSYCTLICESEIMWVTAHTAASTTVTVLRGQEGTAGVAHTSAAWQHGPTAFDLNTFACRVFHNANQNLTTGVELVVAFNSERFDTDTMHDTVTNNGRITINTAGLYLITAHARIQSNATGYREIKIRLNGATAIAESILGANPAQVHVVSFPTLYRLAVNDYLEMTVYQNSGGTLTLDNIGNYSPEFSALRVGN